MRRARRKRPRLPAPALAAALAARLSLTAFEPAAVAAIRERPRGETIAIACSGGADSVALVLGLWAHLPERRGRWLILHFNHRLRGRAAQGDAAAVRALARALGERCATGNWLRPRGSAVPSEAEARAARWDFFRATMRQERARVIALGHNLQDVAETMLMRLTRGSGTAGLAAPRPVQAMGDGTRRVRPLLAVDGATLRRDLRAVGATWREDETNATAAFLRNRVRHRVLPALLAAARQDVLRSFSLSRALLEEDDAALEQWLDELIDFHAAVTVWDTRVLRDRPRALVRRAVHRWFLARAIASAPTRTVVDSVIAAILSGADLSVDVGPARRLVLTGGKLSCVDGAVGVLAPWPEGRLTSGAVLTGPNRDQLRLRRVRLTASLLARIRRGEFPPATTAYFAPEAEWEGWVGVRAWQPGDRYRPLGAPGRAKLQDLFVDRRVPRELRSLLPVVVSARGHVLWVPRLPIADEVAIQPAAKLVVQLTYTPAPPIVHRSTAQIPKDVRLRQA